MFAPAYQPLFERVLASATEGRDDELARARTEYFSQAGEVFEEDRSFEPRMQAFLDWYVFDRVLEGTVDSPARLFALQPGLTSDERYTFRLLARTTHGIFSLLDAGDEWARVHDVAMDLEYEAVLPGPLIGVESGDLFEARLVPYEGQLHFSGAFLFHPANVRKALDREIARQLRTNEWLGVQALVWTLARMASRAEHYRNVPVHTIYDFTRPPPKIPATRIRVDPLAVAERLGRIKPGPTSSR